jgi:hypothetical protein
MIFVSWKRLGRAAKGFGVVWATIALLIAIGNFNNKNNTTEITSTASGATTKVVEKQDVEVAKTNDIEKNKEEADAKRKEEAEAKAKADADAKAAAQVAEEEKKKKENQDAVLAFEKSAYDLEATAKPVFDNYQNVMTAVGQGKASIYDAYSAASNAKTAAQNLQLKFSSLSV